MCKRHLLLLALAVAAAFIVASCGTTRFIMVGDRQLESIYDSSYPPAAPLAAVKKISVMEFVNKTAYGQRRLGSSASDILTSELIKLGLFEAIEREKLQLAINELDLGDLGLIDPAQAIEVGKYVGTEIIVTGSVSQFGHRMEGSDYIFYQSKTQTIEAVVDVRLVEVETTQVIGAFTGRGLARKTTSTLMGTGGRAGYDETLEGDALRAAIIDVVNQMAADTRLLE